MNIRDLFITPATTSSPSHARSRTSRSAGLAPPSYTNSQISASAEKFLVHLRSVKNTALQKGGQTRLAFMKTENYTIKLIKNAENNNDKKIKENLIKVYKHSDKLFSNIESCFNRRAIRYAEAERLKMADIFVPRHFDRR